MTAHAHDAHDAHDAKSAALDDAQRAAVSGAIERLRTLPGALLPILHDIQEHLGFVPPAANELIASALNLSRAEVHGVVTFYHDFRTSPPRAHVLKVCRAEACQAAGCAAIERHLDAKPADDVTVEATYCLGNCALGPSVQLDGRVHGAVTPTSLDALLARARTSTSTSAPSAPAPLATASTAKAVTVYVPGDSAALAMGADDVAAAIVASAAQRNHAVRVVRNGSRGMLWLEPLVEVETAQGRVAYGRVTAADVTSLFDAGFLEGGAHALSHGRTDAIPYLAKQTRFTMARVGVIDPLDTAAYEAHGGLAGLRKALAMQPAAIVEEVTTSGLRGRGGAGFPAGIKWKTVAGAPAREGVSGERDTQKYVVCNADEGDSGTFSDRMLIEGDPFALIEGMTIAGLAVGATQGYVYLRSEYPDARRVLTRAIARAREVGWLGDDVLGSRRAFDVHLRMGAGSYVCGEETAMLESLEGKRGVVRAKPPLPALVGLFGMPTVVNNVMTLASVPPILAKGAAHYASLGVGRSKGTLPFQLAGNIKHGGLVELPFGATLHELLFDYGGGTYTGRPMRAVQVGGPLGSYLPEKLWRTPLDYEAFAAVGGLVGHGGIVVFDDTVDMQAQARYAMEFCAIESCGKCTPCRIGSQRGVEVIDKIGSTNGTKRDYNVALLRDLCTTMKDASLCAMGGLTPLPVLSALDAFPEDFTRPSAPAAAHAQGKRS